MNPQIKNSKKSKISKCLKIRSTVRSKKWAGQDFGLQEQNKRTFLAFVWDFKVLYLFIYASYEDDLYMKNVAFYVDFLKNNIVVPRKWHVPHIFTPVDKVPKVGFRAILRLYPKISIYEVLTMNLSLEIIAFDPNPENVRIRFWKKWLRIFFEKWIFWNFFSVKIHKK